MRQADAAGNAGEVTTAFKIDTAAPAPAVDALGATNDTTPALAGGAGAEDGTHPARAADGATVTVRVWAGTGTSGAPARTLTATRSGSGWAVDATPSLGEGTWTAQAAQDDAAGNTGSSAPRTFRVDLTAPVPTVAAPGSDVRDATPTLSGAAGDATGDDAALTVRVWPGTATGGPAARTLALTRTGAGWNVDVAPALVDGTWTAIASQADAAGNARDSAPLTFKLDTAAPAPVLTAPATGSAAADSTPAFAGTAGTEDGTHPARSADRIAVKVLIHAGAAATGAPVRTLEADRAGQPVGGRAPPRSRTACTPRGPSRRTGPATAARRRRSPSRSTRPRPRPASPCPPPGPTPTTPRPP